MHARVLAPCKAFHTARRHLAQALRPAAALFHAAFSAHRFDGSGAVMPPEKKLPRRGPLAMLWRQDGPRNKVRALVCISLYLSMRGPGCVARAPARFPLLLVGKKKARNKAAWLAVTRAGTWGGSKRRPLDPSCCFGVLERVFW